MDELFNSIYQHYKSELEKVKYVKSQDFSEEPVDGDEEEDSSDTDR